MPDDKGAEDQLWKSDFVAGQVNMLVGFLFTMIDTHPDPAGLLLKFEEQSQSILAKTESRLFKDAFIAGELNIRPLYSSGSLPPGTKPLPTSAAAAPNP